MANMTSDAFRKYRVPTGGLNTRELPLAGYTNFGGGSTAYTVYKGAVVGNDVSDTDGYFRDWDTGITTTSSDIFGGIALEKVDVTSSNTADGSKKVTVAVNGDWAFAKGSLAQTDVGAVAYASDDQTVTTTATAALAIGVIVEVDSTYAWIDISGFAGRVSATTS